MSLEPSSFANIAFDYSKFGVDIKDKRPQTTFAPATCSGEEVEVSSNPNLVLQFTLNTLKTAEFCKKKLQEISLLPPTPAHIICEYIFGMHDAQPLKAPPSEKLELAYFHEMGTIIFG